MSELRFSSASAPRRCTQTRSAATLRTATKSKYRLTRKSHILVSGLTFVRSQISLLMSSLDMSAVTAASKRLQIASKSWARRDLGNEEMNVALVVILHLILKLYFCRRFCSQESAVDSDDELELELSSGCCGCWDCGCAACGWVISTCGWYNCGPVTNIGFIGGNKWCPMLFMSKCAGLGCRHRAVEEDAAPEPVAAALLLERDLSCLPFFLECLPISVTGAQRKPRKCRQGFTGQGPELPLQHLATRTCCRGFSGHGPDWPSQPPTWERPSAPKTMPESLTTRPLEANDHNENTGRAQVLALVPKKYH